MAFGDEISADMGAAINRLHEQLATALSRSVELHRAGAVEQAVLAETAAAVGVARALEDLTGESWETHLERRDQAPAAAQPSEEAPAREPRCPAHSA